MPELEKEDKPKRSIDLSKISILLMFAAGLALMGVSCRGSCTAVYLPACRGWAC